MHRQPPPPHHTHTTHGTGERAQTESESIVPLKKCSFRFLLSTPTDLASKEMMGPAPDEDWGWDIWPDLTFDTPTWKISGTQGIRPNWNWVLTVVYTILSRDFYATRPSFFLSDRLRCDDEEDTVEVISGLYPVHCPNYQSKCSTFPWLDQPTTRMMAASANCCMHSL